jgi:hypothetical protein
MKRKQILKSSDRALATVARVAIGVLAATAGLMIIRSVPDFIRYVKLDRM